MSQYFSISAIKYRPSHTRVATTHATAASKLARSIDRKWKARMIRKSPEGFTYSEAYILTDESGEDIPGTMFYITAHSDLGISEEQSNQLAVVSR